MAENRTRATDADVGAFLASVYPAERREEGQALDRLFRRATGFSPRMWGPSIVGYGRYRYRYESGRTGESAAAGFSPRKADLVLYCVTGFDGMEAHLARIGPHRLGRSCLYLKRLRPDDEAPLEALIQEGLAALARRWPVVPA